FDNGWRNISFSSDSRLNIVIYCSTVDAMMLSGVLEKFIFVVHNNSLWLLNIVYLICDTILLMFMFPYDVCKFIISYVFNIFGHHLVQVIKHLFAFYCFSGFAHIFLLLKITVGKIFNHFGTQRVLAKLLHDDRSCILLQVFLFNFDI